MFINTYWHKYLRSESLGGEERDRFWLPLTPQSLRQIYRNLYKEGLVIMRNMPFCLWWPLSLTEIIKVTKVAFYWRFTCVQYCLSPLSSISLHQSLRKAFLYLLAILWNSAFRWIYLSFSPLPFTSLLFSAICKASSDNHFAYLFFFFFGMVLFTASCTMLQTSIHSSSGTLSISSNPLNLFVTSTV